MNEHDICFKCHAASTNKPQGPSYAQFGYTASRQTDANTGTAFNTLVEFNSTVARHNVVLPRRLSGSEVPSLRANMLSLSGSATGRTLAPGTYIYCGDCHNANDTRIAGGSGAAGAHGDDQANLDLVLGQIKDVPDERRGGAFVSAAALSAVLLVAEKILLRVIARWVRSKGLNYRTILIVGTGEVASGSSIMLRRGRYKVEILDDGAVRSSAWMNITKPCTLGDSPTIACR